MFERTHEASSRDERALRAAAHRDSPVCAYRRRRPPIQAKLTVGAANDPLEREADRVADHVMLALRRMEPGAPPTSLAAVEETRIVRRPGRPNHHVAEVGLAGGEISPTLAGRIQHSSGGAPLDDAVRRRMESAFGVGFGAVRIHAASPLPERIAADAFTVGSRIHFAPGRYDPFSAAGQRLLSHELTHVVQQGGARIRAHRHADEHIGKSEIGRISRADTGRAIRRHSSWEHMLIGDLDPKQLATVGAAYDVAAGARDVTIGKTADGQEIQVDKDDVLHVIEQEIDRLKLFQQKSPIVSSVQKVAPAEKQLKEIEEDARFEKVKRKEGELAAGDDLRNKWDVKLVGIPHNSGKVFLVTYGELNTLADFFGNLDELTKIDVRFLDRLIRGVRQSTMRQLVKVYAAASEMSAKEARSALGLESTKFRSRRGKADAIKLGGMIAELQLMGVTNKTSRGIGKGRAKPKVEGDESTTYKSTLARNACHFAPESWHMWASYHRQARDLATEAYQAAVDAKSLRGAEQKAKQQEAAEKANKALLTNGFGDHYLQDSYAAGHLINKTAIMQWYVQWLDQHRGKWDAHFDSTWRKMQQMAYGQPGLAATSQYAKWRVGEHLVKGQTVSSARDPQSAENLKGVDWSVKAEALGLRVPSSLRDDNAKALLREWQRVCYLAGEDKTPRDQSFRNLVRMGKKVGLDEATAEKAIRALLRDGIIHLTKYSPADRSDVHPVLKGKWLTLRDAYIPSTRKSMKRAQSDKAFERMALGVTYNEYLEFMNSAFLQKATNFIHDKWCREGLRVKAGDSTEVFKVYGDNNMIQKESSRGLFHSGETARMSRDAILEFIDTGSSQFSTDDILERFPDGVEIEPGTTVSLAKWNTEHLRAMCEESIFESMSAFGKTVVVNKIAPGMLGPKLGKVAKEGPVHPPDVF